MRLAEAKVENILFLVEKAEAAILDIYHSSEFKIEEKKDKSPVTAADKISHSIIVEGLNEIFPGLPIISEEAAAASYQKRKDWPYFWLVDPLDGTKEFILKNDEFTVNLALIEKNIPVLGVVAAPAKGEVYFAFSGKGAYKKTAEKKAKLLKAKKESGPEIIVARSRAHKNKKEEDFVSKFGKVKTVDAGSSLKFCLVAEARADIYLRGGPTMEWDTAAGQCIAAEAGAQTYTLGGSPFFYNKKSLLNPGLVCTANKELKEKIGFFKG